MPTSSEAANSWLLARTCALRRAGQAVQAPAALGSGREAPVRNVLCWWSSRGLLRRAPQEGSHALLPAPFLPPPSSPGRPSGVPACPARTVSHPPSLGVRRRRRTRCGVTARRFASSTYGSTPPVRPARVPCIGPSGAGTPPSPLRREGASIARLAQILQTSPFSNSPALRLPGSIFTPAPEWAALGARPWGRAPAKGRRAPGTPAAGRGGGGEACRSGWIPPLPCPGLRGPARP